MDGLVNAWTSTLLSCPLLWRFCDSDDAKYFHCLNYREAKAEEARAMTYDAIQVVYDVWSFRVRKGGSIGAKELSKLYDEHVKFSATQSEPRSEAMIDSCLTIAKRMLAVKEIKDELTILQARDDFPLNSVTKLQLIIDKCSSTSKIVWWLTKLNDDLQSKVIEFNFTLNLKELFARVYVNCCAQRRASDMLF